MANAVTTTSFDAISPVRLELFVDSVGAYDADLFESAGEQATALVLSACRNAGYAIADAVSDAVVVGVATRLCVLQAHSGRMHELPAGIGTPMEDVAAIASGRMPLLAVDPDSAEAQGGSSWTSSSSTSGSGRPAIMRELRKVFW